MPLAFGRAIGRDAVLRRAFMGIVLPATSPHCLLATSNESGVMGWSTIHSSRTSSAPAWLPNSLVGCRPRSRKRWHLAQPSMSRTCPGHLCADMKLSASVLSVKRRNKTAACRKQTMSALLLFLAMKCPGLSRTIAVNLLSFFLLLNLSKKQKTRKRWLRAREAFGCPRTGNHPTTIGNSRPTMAWGTSQASSPSSPTTGSASQASAAPSSIGPRHGATVSGR